MTSHPIPRGARSAIVRVGDGRGFVVEGERGRMVITAAHCLPHLPPAIGEAHSYARLVGPLGRKRSLWADCLFADPCRDVAVLCEPDSQQRGTEWQAFDALIQGANVLPIADQPKGRAWLLHKTTDEWMGCTVETIGNGGYWVDGFKKGIQEGMSGSPILSDSGAAIGVVYGSSRTQRQQTGGGPNARLATDLPGWFLREFGFRNAAWATLGHQGQQVVAIRDR